MHCYGWICAVLLCSSGAIAEAATAATAATAVPRLSNDLAEIRDLTDVTISPDGNVVAVRLVEPRLETNTYKLTWIIHPLQPGKGRIHHIDAGLPIFSYGYVLANEPPQWSPSSRWLYFRALKKSGDCIQVWRADRHTGSVERVTDEAGDVEAFSLSGHDGIYISVRPSLAKIREEEQREFDGGIVLTKSVRPWAGLHESLNLNGRATSPRVFSDEQGRDVVKPLLSSVPSVLKFVRAGNLSSSFSADQAVKDLHRRQASHLPDGRDSPTSPASSLVDGRRATLTPVGAGQGGVRPPVELRVETPDGASYVQCEAAVCKGAIRAIGWRPETDEVLFIVESGGALSGTLYGWRVGATEPRKIYSSGGMIGRESSPSGGAQPEVCPAIKDEIVCVAASASTPPRLVAISLVDGRERMLLSPNELLRSRLQDRVREISWESSSGTAQSGVLVLPDTSGAGPYPLVILSARCRGFLRGGAGAEYPEHLLAARGIASLCWNIDQRRQTSSSSVGAGDPLDLSRDAISAFDGAIHTLSAQGIIDQSKVGLAGLSIGATFAEFALFNSGSFAAIATSGIGLADPLLWAWYSGFENTPSSRFLARYGVSEPAHQNPEAWKKVSPAMNVASIRVPLLVQSAEDEFRLTYGLFASLMHEKKPVEMVIYPGEGHQKNVFPRHRLSAMERNADWFSFWLKGKVPVAELDPDRGERWKKLQILTQHWRAISGG